MAASREGRSGPRRTSDMALNSGIAKWLRAASPARAGGMSAGEDAGARAALTRPLDPEEHNSASPLGSQRLDLGRPRMADRGDCWTGNAEVHLCVVSAVGSGQAVVGNHYLQFGATNSSDGILLVQVGATVRSYSSTRSPRICSRRSSSASSNRSTMALASSRCDRSSRATSSMSCSRSHLRKVPSICCWSVRASATCCVESANACSLGVMRSRVRCSSNVVSCSTRCLPSASAAAASYCAQDR